MDDRDKRDYYRLADNILVEHQLVSEQEVTSHNAEDFFTSDPNFHLLRDIFEQQLEAKELLRSITQDNRALGRFLGNLDTRVEMLAKAIMASSLSPQSGYTEAEISEGGLSFESPSLIRAGEFLALKLLFQPTFLGISCFAEVKHCRLSGPDYRIGVEFKHLDDKSRRLISRHIISRQAEQRRARLHNS